MIIIVVTEVLLSIILRSSFFFPLKFLWHRKNSFKNNLCFFSLCNRKGRSYFVLNVNDHGAIENVTIEEVRTSGQLMYSTA
jgi:hypothetical protein